MSCETSLRDMKKHDHDYHFSFSFYHREDNSFGIVWTSAILLVKYSLSHLAFISLVQKGICWT